MKRLLLGAPNEALLSAAEGILKQLGYRVLVSSRPEELFAFLKKSDLNLLILESDFLKDKTSSLFTEVEAKVKGDCPLIILGKDTCPIPHENLPLPLDLFGLFQSVQKYMEKFPRKNIRLNVNLPGMIEHKGKTNMSQISSLSAEGVFMTTGILAERDEKLRVHVPLVGMKTELDLEGQVLYRVHPSEENNYMQGLGIGFTDLTADARKKIEIFLEREFLEMVTRRQGMMDKEQLQTHENEEPHTA